MAQAEKLQGNFVKAQKVDGHESTGSLACYSVSGPGNVVQPTGGDVGVINFFKKHRVSPLLEARQNRQGTFALTGGFVQQSSSCTGSP